MQFTMRKGQFPISTVERIFVELSPAIFADRYKFEMFFDQLLDTVRCIISNNPFTIPYPTARYFSFLGTDIHEDLGHVV